MMQMVRVNTLRFGGLADLVAMAGREAVGLRVLQAAVVYRCCATTDENGFIRVAPSVTQITVNHQRLYSIL
jgi:hypothetical protein